VSLDTLRSAEATAEPSLIDVLKQGPGHSHGPHPKAPIRCETSSTPTTKTRTLIFFTCLLVYTRTIRVHRTDPCRPLRPFFTTSASAQIHANAPTVYAIIGHKLITLDFGVSDDVWEENIRSSTTLRLA